jgi:hypothetical protein
MAKDKDIRQGRAELKKARADLARVSDRDKRHGIRDETPQYLRANRAVLDAEKKLPWWAR